MMKNHSSKIVLLILPLFAFLIFVPVTIAQEDSEQPVGRDPEFEQEVYNSLAEINPEAVPVFQEATVAMDAGQLQVAKKGYQRVLMMAPDFPPALRRLSYVEDALGNTDKSIAYAEKAFALDDSFLNRSALAAALLSVDTPKSNAEALVHAQAAVEEAPQDDYVNFILLLAGAANEDIEVMRQASTTLVEVAPGSPIAYFFASWVAAEDGKWEEAERLLIQAQELGMPKEEIDAAYASSIASQARLYRWLRRSAYTFIGWLVGIGVLFLGGSLLSQITLKTVQRTRLVTNPQPTVKERFIRTIYGIVIAVSSFYFYVSIPILILIILAIGAGIGYLFLTFGQIPIRLGLFIALAIIYTLYAIIRSVFTRVQEGEPGRKLTRGEAPRLWDLMEEVAQSIETRPVDAIYINPGTGIAVTERGGMLDKLRDNGYRILILGLGSLNGLNQSQFKAIAAHEYGHFSNRDTAGGALAFQVKISMSHMAYRLVSSGQAKWYNPAWIFVNGYYRIFLRMSLGASRLQEILADRHAAMAFGYQNFVEGLKHVIKRSLIFDMETSHEIEQAAKDKRPLYNLYQLPEIKDKRDEVEKAFLQIMEKPTSPYDSHPSIGDRIAFVEALEIEPKVEDNASLVWDMIPNTTSLQNEMTAVVENNVRASGLF